MEAKQIAVLAIGGVAVVGAVIYATKKMGSDSAPVAQTGTVVNNSPSLPSYTPTVQTYQPLPIGAIASGSKDSSPPGVNPAGLEVDPKPSVNTNTSRPPAQEEEDAVSDLLASMPGVATQPTPPKTGTPANPLTGNAAVIDGLYMELFGRHAEKDGLDFWLRHVESGQVDAGNIVQNLVRGAQNEDAPAVAMRRPDLVIAYR